MESPFLNVMKNVEWPDGYISSGEGDRHGSYEWSCSNSQDNDGLTRFVAIALTSVSQLRESRLEVWAGANSSDGHFGRHLVVRWDSVNPTSQEEPLASELPDAVMHAGERANRLGHADLNLSGIIRTAERPPTD